jgi:SAM-dependent methyltransferase
LPQLVQDATAPSLSPACSLFGHDGAVIELSHDQKPQGWSAGAAGYETAFAPLTNLFVADAIQLLGLKPPERLVLKPAERFLDVCAGTGALALPVARLGTDVTAVDFAPGMVALLRERMQSAGLSARVEEMDGQALDLPDAYFDAAASMFGLIFFPDLGAGMRELVRVTRPGGRVLVGAWDQARFPLAAAVGRAMATLAAAPQGPSEVPIAMRLGERGRLEDACESAGLVDVHVHEVTHTWAIDYPEQFFTSLPDWSPPIQPVLAALPPMAIARVRDGFIEAVRDLSSMTGGLETTALLAVGRRPST